MTRGGQWLLSFHQILQPKRLKDWPGCCVIPDVNLRVEKNCCTDSRGLSGAGRTTAKTIITL